MFSNGDYYMHPHFQNCIHLCSWSSHNCHRLWPPILDSPFSFPLKVTAVLRALGSQEQGAADLFVESRTWMRPCRLPDGATAQKCRPSHLALSLVAGRAFRAQENSPLQALWLACAKTGLRGAAGPGAGLNLQGPGSACQRAISRILESLAANIKYVFYFSLVLVPWMHGSPRNQGKRGWSGQHKIWAFLAVIFPNLMIKFPPILIDIWTF